MNESISSFSSEKEKKKKKSNKIFTSTLNVMNIVMK